MRRIRGRDRYAPKALGGAALLVAQEEAVLG